MPNFESYVQQAPSKEKGGSRSTERMDEREIDTRVAFAKSLTELACVLYQAGEIQGRGPKGRRYTSNQLMAIVLEVSGDLISADPTKPWGEQREYITNAHGIRRAVDRILFTKQGKVILPTFADRLLRKFHNFKEDNEHPKRTPRPSEDLPTNPQAYLQQMTEEGFVHAMDRYRPTHQPMTNQQFVMFLMSKMGLPEEPMDAEEKAVFAKVEEHHRERFSQGFETPKTLQELIAQLRAHDNAIILSDEATKAKHTVQIGSFSGNKVADRLEQWIAGGKTAEGLRNILAMVESRKELQEIIQRLAR